MADIFLSYARRDGAKAAAVADALQAEGYSVWFDADLPAHRAYSEVIEEQLEAASAVIVLWSKDAVSSQWVRSEANRARETDRLIQARLDQAARLPMPFDQIQCADLTGKGAVSDAPGWRRLLKSIAALTGEPMPATAAAGGTVSAPVAPSSRRGLLIGGAAAAAVATAGGGWWLLARKDAGPPVSPETEALMTQARAALWQNTPEGQNQAIGIYRQVVAANPGFANAWGRLAMAYSWTAHWREAKVGATMRSRARSAAQQALALDPQDVHALFGLAFAKPWMGNWRAIESDLQKALKLSPRDSEVNLGLALMRWAVGRVRAALDLTGVILASGPTPGIYVFLANMLWSAGRQEQLDSTLDEATKLYPTHFGLWFTRFYTLMMGGRPEAALALAADTSTRPINISAAEIDSVVVVARAVQADSPAATDAVVKEWRERAHRGAGLAENAAQFMATLGRFDDAFAVLRAYYFSEGFDCGEVRFDQAAGSFTPRNDRQTAFLFNPSFASMRSDPRFTKLVNDLKLADYWRTSGTKPDYLG